MSIARDRANRVGSDPVIIGSSKISANDSDNLVIQDTSNVAKRFIVSEMHIGDNDSDKVVIKRNSSTGKIQLQTIESGGSAQDQQSGAAEIYANPTLLPTSGVSAGAHALTTSNNFLYVYNGSGWYKIAEITNASPTISSAGNASYTFATDGTPVSITITASDPEVGTALQYKYTVTSGSIGSTASVTSSATSGGTYSALAVNTLTTNKYFKITPSTNSAHAGSFSLTFSASDGVNVANSSASAFTLAFLPSGSTYFDGSNDYLNTSSTSSDFEFGTGDFTVEMWIKPDFNTSINQTHGDYIWEIGPNQYVSMQIKNGNLTAADYNTGVLVTQAIGNIQGTWHHIALTRESQTYKMWYDGSLSGSNSTSTWDIKDYLSAGGLKLHIGNHTYYGGNYEFHGYISNFRAIKGTAIYTSAFTVPTSPLSAITGTVLLTCQNDASGSVTQDRSASNHSLTSHPIGGSGPTTNNDHPF